MANITMTKTEYSRHKGVELAAVKRAIDEGRIPELAIKIGSNNRQLIIVAEADKFWDENTIVNNKNEHRQKSLNLKDDPGPANNQSGKGQANQPQAGSRLNDYRTVREGYTAKMAQIDYEERVGKLTPTSDVKKAATEMATNIKSALENFANKLAPILAGETTAERCYRILTDEVRGLLDNLSRGEFGIDEGAENE